MEIVMLRVPTWDGQKPWIQASELGLIDQVLVKVQVALELPDVTFGQEEWASPTSKMLRSCVILGIGERVHEVGDFILSFLYEKGYELQSGSLHMEGSKVTYPQFCVYCLVKK